MTYRYETAATAHCRGTISLSASRSASCHFSLPIAVLPAANDRSPSYAMLGS